MTIQNFKAFYFLELKMSQKHRKWWNYLKRHVWDFENVKKYQIWIFEDNQTKKICFVINVIGVKTYSFPGLTRSREESLSDAEGQTDQYHWYRRSKQPVVHVSHEVFKFTAFNYCDYLWRGFDHERFWNNLIWVELTRLANSNLSRFESLQITARVVFPWLNLI